MSSKIIALGDSTMQFNDFKKFPQTGWPQALTRFIKPEVQILNFAKNGRSTKSFIDQKLFDCALNYIEENDLVLIEFGHNDSKISDSLRYCEAKTTYKENLRMMIRMVQSKRADVILLTPIAERKFVNGEIVNTHQDYPQRVKEVASEENVTCIDLHDLTMKVIQETGEEKSKKFFMNFSDGIYNNINEKHDDTHLRYDGAFMVASCFYDEMKRLNFRQELFLE